MHSSQSIQQEIVDTFNQAGDAFNQFTCLLEYASKLPEMSPELMVGDALVAGCQSQVWLYVTADNGVLHMQGESDTLMVRGILFILQQMFDGHALEEVAACPMTFIQQTELANVFDSKRIAGTKAILTRIKAVAQAAGGPAEDRL